MRKGAAGLAACALLLAACDSGGSSAPEPSASPPDPDASLVSPVPGTADVATDDPALDAAVSKPVEDSVYPSKGDPGVDALHYDLALGWTPDADTLTAVETLVFRATADADHVQLDLAEPLHVSSVTLDGEDVDYRHDGKDLVVAAPVTGDRRYTLVVHYAGVPEPVPAPTTREDLSQLGWTVDARHQVWTMQEPYGAYSWYAVNDQPSDKALYSFTIAAPAPMVGVANGRLTSREQRHGDTVTTWSLDEPASSYLVTIAIGDLRMTKDRSADGVPISYWTPRSAPPDTVERLRETPAALAWLEQRLGPFPFSSLGILIVDSQSGMETQTMITLGNSDYATSPEVLVHEIAHQWYGDEVTPADWRDVWMNEGMALYLQGVWQAEHDGQSVDDLMDYWATLEPQMRREAGPPADYDPNMFGSQNIYFGPALMWHELRHKVGDEEFWSLVRAWPRAHDDGNASYADLTAWWSQRTGMDLKPFFDLWLLSRTSPAGS